MSIVKSYVKQVLAKLTGDDNQVIAERNYRKAVAAVKGQISALESRLVEDETSVEEAKEVLENMKYPTTEIKGGTQQFIQNVVNQQERVDTAIDSLERTQKAINYQKALLLEFEQEA